MTLVMSAKPIQSGCGNWVGATACGMSTAISIAGIAAREGPFEAAGRIEGWTRDAGQVAQSFGGKAMSRGLSKCAIVVTAALVGGGLSFAQSDGSLRGKITGYECGDNCYLTITDEFGMEHTGLCVADACRPWNKVAEMPRRHLGKTVVVQITMGTQLDGSGNPAGRMMAFRTLRFR